MNDPNRLTSTSDLVIAHLRHIGDAPTTNKEIAAAVGRTLPNVREVVARLVRSYDLILLARRTGPGGGSSYAFPR